jgi:plasmid stabilization system protein ParE
VTAVYWSPQSGDDLAAIYAYIAVDSEHYALLTVRELIAATGRLREFPEIGRRVPELSRPDIREVIWRSYRLVYQYLPTQDEVRVLTVFRAERMLQVPQDLR